MRAKCKMCSREIADGEQAVKVQIGKYSYGKRGRQSDRTKEWFHQACYPVMVKE
jgi:hypothetical protein